VRRTWDSMLAAGSVLVVWWLGRASDMGLNAHSWLSTGSLVVRASDMGLNGREFDPRRPHCQSVDNGMGVQLWAGIPLRYVTSQRHHVGPGYPPFPAFFPPLSIHFLIARYYFFTSSIFPFLVRFNYFLNVHPSFSTSFCSLCVICIAWLRFILVFCCIWLSLILIAIFVLKGDVKLQLTN